MGNLSRMGLKITKTQFALLAIFILALVLRFIAASHAVIGSDELVYSSIPYNIIAAGRLSTWQQSQLHFYLNDLGYMIFGGVTPISTRLPSVIFGSFAVFVVFLLGRDLFGQKAGLIAAFLFAVSGYAIRNNVELDMPAFFFALLSAFFFLRWLGTNHSTNVYFSSLFLGIAVMIKSLTLLFIPAYVIVWGVHTIKKKSSAALLDNAKNSFRKQMEPLLIGIAIFIIVLSPIFVYNYLLYTDKGVTDFYFATMLGIGENVYGGLENKPWAFSALLTRSWWLVKQFLKFDGLLFVLGTIGMLSVFRKKKYEVTLFLLSIFFLFGYVAGITGSPTHYLWVPLLLSIFAAPFLLFVKEKLAQRFQFKQFLLVILIIIFVSNMFLLSDILTKKNAVLSLREYVHENIPDDAIVVLDPRIYRGIYAWAFADKHYLEGTSFPQLLDLLKESGSPAVSVPIYYIECGKGTECIWSKEDYERVNEFGERLTSYFKNSTQQIAQIKGQAVKAGDRHTFIVYRGTIAAPIKIYEAIDRTHVFWLYPVGWKYTDDVFDNYQTKGFGKLLNGFGFLALYTTLVISLLALPYTLYLVFKKQADQAINNEC